REHVFELTLVGLRPENVAGGYLNKVCRDPQPLVGLPHAPSKNRVDFELTANLANVLGLSLKLEYIGRCDHPHARSLSQCIDRLFRYPIAEELLFLSRA